MKIIERTLSKLNIEMQLGHWVVLGVFFGLPFLGAGLLVNALAGRYVTLECQRTAAQAPVTCQVKKLSILGQEINPVPGQLKSAEVRRAPQGKNIYTVVLLTDRQKIQLTPEGTDRWLSDQSVDAINQFLQNPDQPSLRTSQATFPLFIGMLFTFIGSGIILLALTYPLPYFCSFDRTTGQLLLKRYSVLLGHRQILQNFSDIETVSTDGPIQKGRKTYQVQLILKTGKTLDLSGVKSYNPDNYQQIAAAIREFLHQ